MVNSLQRMCVCICAFLKYSSHIKTYNYLILVLGCSRKTNIDTYIDTWMDGYDRKMALFSL